MTLWDVAAVTGAILAWMAAAAGSAWCILDGMDQGYSWRDYNWRKIGVGLAGSFLVLGSLVWLVATNNAPYCPRQCRSSVVTYVPTNSTTVIPMYSETCDWDCARRLDERR